MTERQQLLQLLVKAQDDNCGWCGKSLTHWGLDGIDIDHWRPKCQGGGNEWDNLFAMHKRCNRSHKGNQWQHLKRPKPTKLAREEVECTKS